MNYITDLIFLVGTIFFSLSFLNKDDKKTLKLQFISILLFNIAVFFTKASDASIANSIIGLLFISIGLVFPKDIKKKIAYIIPLFLILACIFLDSSEGTIFTFLGIFFSAIAALVDNVVKMKIWYLLSNISWLSFAIYLNEPGMIIFDLVGLISLIYFFIEYYVYNRKKD